MYYARRRVNDTQESAVTAGVGLPHLEALDRALQLELQLLPVHLARASGGGQRVRDGR